MTNNNSIIQNRQNKTNPTVLFKTKPLPKIENKLKTELMTINSASELFVEIENINFKPIENPKFTFIDLFAGIGGFRIALQNLGGECVFTSEWDKDAQLTYKTNFGEMPFGDITKKEIKEQIPANFDVLCAGYQEFLLAL